MNAEVGYPSPRIESCQFRAPAAGLRQFALRLGRDRRSGKVSDAAFYYAVDEDLLGDLVDLWCDELCSHADDQLVLQPWFRMIDALGELCFLHQRSSTADAVPILLLHGRWGSLADLPAMVSTLSSPPTPSFHVVSPALPGFGLTPAIDDPSVREVAQACAALMARLGYARYVVHGSDIGASIAAELAAIAGEHVIAIHVTSLHVLPSEDAHDAAELTSPEKSQLALLTLQHEELRFADTESPVDDLASALQQLGDWEAPLSDFAPLLHSLTLAWAFGEARARRALCLSHLRRAPRFTAPVAIESHALDAPCLRRLAERQFHVLSFVQHEHGGSLPALESPRALTESLRRAFADAR